MHSILRSRPRLRRWTQKRIERVARQADLGVHPCVKILDRKVTREFSEKDTLAAFLAGIGPGAFFVQIGANDGLKNDPIHTIVRRFSIQGLLVEPQREVFEKLLENYKGVPNLRFERAAIGHRDGVQKLYRVNESIMRQEKLPVRNFSGVSSLSREQIASYLKAWAGKSALAEDMDRYVAEETVPTLTFDSLLSKHRISHFDLLIIDAEGFDYDIIKMVDFERFKPGLIFYEHFLLPETDRLGCWQYLKSLGYDCVVTYKDTVAIRNPASQVTDRRCSFS